MVEPIPTKRWWKRKRWLAVGSLWLLAAYAVILGPVTLAALRGWLPPPVADVILLPAELASRLPVIGPAIKRGTTWWTAKALEYDGYTVEVAPDGTISGSKADLSALRAAEEEQKRLIERMRRRQASD